MNNCSKQLNTYVLNSYVHLFWTVMYNCSEQLCTTVLNSALHLHWTVLYLWTAHCCTSVLCSALVFQESTAKTLFNNRHNFFFSSIPTPCLVLKFQQQARSRSETFGQKNVAKNASTSACHWTGRNWSECCTSSLSQYFSVIHGNPALTDIVLTSTLHCTVQYSTALFRAVV